MTLSRRRILAVSAAALGGASNPIDSFAACKTKIAATEFISGPPEYVPGVPIRHAITEGTASQQRVRLFGRALTIDCTPLAGARLDFWQTDANGKYDMKGASFRAGQIIDRQGRFRLDTVMPGPYGSERHIHFLLAARLGNRPQPLMVSGAVWFPTPEEFAKAKPNIRTAEYLAPDTLPIVDGVLLAQCDIVLETA